MPDEGNRPTARTVGFVRVRAMLHRRLVAAALCALLTSACSTTATISRNRGPAYEAKITRSEPDALYVLGDDGREYRVPAEEVREIDHPGNVLALLGGISLGIALLVAATPVDTNDFDADDQRENKFVAASVYGLLGVGLFVPGLAIWMRSHGAASALRPAAAGLPPEAYPAEPRPLAR